MQTARIRHGDKGRMSNTLTDESETPSLSLSLPLSVFSRLIFALSLPPPAPTPPTHTRSAPPSHSYLHLSGCRSIFTVSPALSSYHSPPFSSCQMLFRSLLSQARLLPPSSLFPYHFPHLLSLSASISVCTSLSKFDFFFVCQVTSYRV